VLPAGASAGALVPTHAAQFLPPKHDYFRVSYDL
jgi:hypothetical protein